MTKMRPALRCATEHLKYHSSPDGEDVANAVIVVAQFC